MDRILTLALSKHWLLEQRATEVSFVYVTISKYRRVYRRCLVCFLLIAGVHQHLLTYLLEWLTY